MTDGVVVDEGRRGRTGLSGPAIRRLLWLIVVIQAVTAIGFILQIPVLTRLWPFPGQVPMSNTFIASIFLAAAASTSWCLVVRSDRALAGIALDYLTIMVPFLVLSVLATADGGGLATAGFGLACAIGIAAGVLLMRWALTHDWGPPMSTPAPVLVAFAVFLIALIVFGSLLVLQVPGTLPWSVTPQLSRLYGFMFLGAGVYFAYGLMDRRWENAGGQLAGFLAYDLVLVIPLLRELLAPGGGGYARSAGGMSLNLALYVVVVVGSGLLATWYLLVRRDTSIWNALRRGDPA